MNTQNVPKLKPIRFCGCCLTVESKLLGFKDGITKNFLQRLLNKNGLAQTAELNYICYECRAMLRNTHQFIKKTVKAQKLLQLLYLKPTFDLDTLKELDRQTLKLNSRLSYQEGICIDIAPVLQVKEDKTEATAVIAESDSEIDEPKQNRQSTPNNVFPDGSNVVETADDPRNTNGIDVDKIKYEPIQNNKLDDEFENDTGGNNQLDDKFEGISKIETSNIETLEENIVNYKPVMQPNVQPITRKKPRREPKSYFYYEILDSSSENENPNTMTDNVVSGKRQRKKIELKEDNDDSDELNLVEVKKKMKQNKNSEDEEFYPDACSPSNSSDSEPHDMYDDSGKRLKKPKALDYPCQCEYCVCEIPSRAQHFIHHLRFHPTEKYYYERDKIYVCQYCGKGKTTVKLLQNHELTHGKKKVPCTMCDKKFFNRSRVLRHIWNCHKEKRYTCDYCNKRFAQFSSLKIHIRVHTGEKPFKCHICGAGFAHKGNVGIHIRTNHQHEKHSKRNKRKEQTDYSDDSQTNKRRKKKKTRRRTTNDESESDSQTSRRRTKKIKKRKRKPIPRDTESEANE